MQKFTALHALTLLAGCVLLAAAPRAPADVTTQQKTSLNLAGIIRMNGTSTESLSGDKQRNEDCGDKSSSASAEPGCAGIFCAKPLDDHGLSFASAAGSA